MLRKVNKSRQPSKADHETSTINGFPERCQKEADRSFCGHLKVSKRRGCLLEIPKTPEKGKDLNNLKKNSFETLQIERLRVISTIVTMQL